MNVTEPGSGIASPRLANGEPVWYGKRLRSIVVGASGSFLERKSSQARRPRLRPKRFSNACRASADCSSRPPPLPNIPPISEAVAITSVPFQSSGPVIPNAAYSPGISVGFSARLGDVLR